jgi:hypothetical protein
MLKKIALIGIFAVTSVVSFGGASNASNGPTKTTTVRSGQVMRGFCYIFGNMRC